LRRERAPTRSSLSEHPRDRKKEKGKEREMRTRTNNHGQTFDSRTKAGQSFQL
jgi:hypothetical protein